MRGGVSRAELSELLAGVRRYLEATYTYREVDDDILVEDDTLAPVSDDEGPLACVAPAPVDAPASSARPSRAPSSQGECFPLAASAPMQPSCPPTTQPSPKRSASPRGRLFGSASSSPRSSRQPVLAGAPDFSRLFDKLDASFSETLLRLIDEGGFTDAQVYRRAGVSRQLFSKIRKDPGYRPTKQTALALAIALELPLEGVRGLLERAGFALSHSSKADVIAEYFIVNGIYDIVTINQVLYEFDQPLLGQGR